MVNLVSRLGGASSLLAFKAPIVAGSTGNLTLLSGYQVVDGITLTSTMHPDLRRVLVKDQTDATQNGVYEMNQAAWQRAKDFNSVADFRKGTRLYVNGGNTQAMTGWVVTSAMDPEVFELDDDDIDIEAMVDPVLLDPLVELSANNTPFQTRTEVESATILAAQKSLRTNAYATAGDLGGAIYVRVSSQPSHAGRVRSLDRFLPSGATDNTNGGWWELSGPSYNTAMFGATSSADCVTAITDAVACITAQGARELIVAPFRHSIASIVTFSLPNFSKLTFLGSIRPTFTGGIAVRIGSTSAVSSTIGLDVRGIYVDRANYSDITQVLVELRSLMSCTVTFSWTSIGLIGVYCNGTAANGGFSYNQIHLGFHHDAVFNVYLDASGVGYCNENNFYGGTLNHSTSFTAAFPTTNTTNITVNHFVTSQLNNNRFWGPSLEDTNDPTYARAATIEGEHNVIDRPRMENSHTQATYAIYLTANSARCEIVPGYSMVATNVSDSGTNNNVRTNHSHAVKFTSGAGNAGMTIQNTNTSSAKLLVGLGSTGAENFTLTGTGAVNIAGAYSISGLQVVGARQSAITDSSSSNAHTQLNLLLAVARTHGLIST